jgi:hypothetical protein
MAELKSSQARKIVARVAGSALPGSAVRIKRISQISRDAAEVLAEIETPFRFQLNTESAWTVREVRVAPDRWERVPMITSECAAVDLNNQRKSSSAPSPRHARCLLAAILHVQLPSDAVRIKEVSPSALPLVSQPSALVTAVIQLEFRFTKPTKGDWRIEGVRSGNSGWIDLDTLANRLNEQKRADALAEMQVVAQALEKFHADRGTYVTSDKQAVLIDHLSPRYLTRVLRLDPWNRPYQYHGERDRFTLRSDGPDGKENTADDIVFSSR